MSRKMAFGGWSFTGGIRKHNVSFCINQSQRKFSRDQNAREKLHLERFKENPSEIFQTRKFKKKFLSKIMTQTKGKIS